MLSPHERHIDARLVMSMIACGIMSFSGIVVETAMNVTFPALMSEFSVNTATVQWVTTGYLLVLTAIMPLSSFLKCRFKTKALFTFAITCFLLGTIACAAAPAFSLLIAGRLLQGIGTGIALPLMYNIIIEQVPYDRMGLMMGVATLITAIAPAVGPSLGGFIATYWGWRMIFVVLIPLLVISAACGIATIRQVSETWKARFSIMQFLFVAGGFSCLVFAVNTASDAGWASAQVLGLLLCGVALLALYCVVSRKSPNPLIRVSVFTVKPFAFSVAYIMLISAIVLGLGYLIPYYAQTVCGASELVAGCLLLPGCTIGAILAPVGGRILDKLGAVKPISLGAVCQLAAVCLLAMLAVESEPWVLAMIYPLMSIAQGLSMSNSMTNGLRNLPDDLQSEGNAAFNTLQQLGGALGTAVITSIVGAAQAATSESLVEGTMAGTQSGLFVLLAISAVACACALAALATSKRQGSSKSADAPVKSASANTSRSSDLQHHQIVG